MSDNRLPREDRAALQRTERRQSIMTAALVEAAAAGYDKMTREGVASRAAVSSSSINHEFGTMDALREVVMSEAIEAGHLIIIAQGLANGHPLARAAPEHLRLEAVRALA